MAKQFPASKTQQKRLAALGVDFSQYITYSEAGKLLQAKGWTVDGRDEEVYSDDLHIDGYNDI